MCALCNTLTLVLEKAKYLQNKTEAHKNLLDDLPERLGNITQKLEELLNHSKEALADVSEAVGLFNANVGPINDIKVKILTVKTLLQGSLYLYMVMQ